jgi:hypothetical protein
MDNILSDQNRHHFLQTGSLNDINEYFNSLQKLANKKGGIYKTLYENDTIFYLNRPTPAPTPTQNGGNFFTWLLGTGNKNKQVFEKGTYCDKNKGECDIDILARLNAKIVFAENGGDVNGESEGGKNMNIIILL